MADDDVHALSVMNYLPVLGYFMTERLVGSGDKICRCRMGWDGGQRELCEKQSRIEV